jgi:tRNA(fMet)-specific endonuclease VapC
MEYLIDTDWAIDYMNGHQPVVQRFDELSPLGIGLSIVSLAELYDGMFGAEERLAAEQGLQSFLDYIEEVVPLDDPVCRVFALERRRLRATGNRLDDLDLLIGSTAIHHGLTLLTNNRRHFERMRELNIISA